MEEWKLGNETDEKQMTPTWSLTKNCGNTLMVGSSERI